MSENNENVVLEENATQNQEISDSKVELNESTVSNDEIKITEQETASKPKKKRKGLRIVIWVLILLLIAGAGVYVYLFGLPIPKSKEVSYVSLVDGDYQLLTKLESQADVAKISSIGGEDTFASSLLLRFTEDGKYIYFINHYDKEAFDGTLNRILASDAKKEPDKVGNMVEKIASHVCIYDWDVVGSNAVYLSDLDSEQRGKLQYFDGETSTCIEKNVVGFRVCEDQTAFVYYKKNDDGKYVIFQCNVGEDMTPEKVVSGADGGVEMLSSDGQSLLYSVDIGDENNPVEELHLYKADGEDVVIADRIDDVYGSSCDDFYYMVPVKDAQPLSDFVENDIGTQGDVKPVLSNYQYKHITWMGTYYYRYYWDYHYDSYNADLAKYEAKQAIKDGTYTVPSYYIYHYVDGTTECIAKNVTSWNFLSYDDHVIQYRTCDGEPEIIKLSELVGGKSLTETLDEWYSNPENSKLFISINGVDSEIDDNLEHLYYSSDAQFLVASVYETVNENITVIDDEQETNAEGLTATEESNDVADEIEEVESLEEDEQAETETETDSDSDATETEEDIKAQNTLVLKKYTISDNKLIEAGIITEEAHTSAYQGFRGDKFYYFEDVNKAKASDEKYSYSEYGDFMVYDGNESVRITGDVSLEGFAGYADGTVLFKSDYKYNLDKYESTYTLWTYNGKEAVEVYDDVSSFTKLSDGSILLLSDNDLILYKGDKTTRLQYDVDYFWTNDAMEKDVTYIY